MRPNWFIISSLTFIATAVACNTYRLSRIESKIDCFSLSSEASPVGAGLIENYCGVEQRVARQAHNLEVVGSNPTPAIIGLDNGAGLSPPPPQKRSDFTTETCPCFEVTAYCGKSCCCGKWADGYTASGHKIVQGDKFVAAPPDIPFGTLLAIDGYAGGLAVPVLDRGGAIQGNKLDVFFGGENGHQEALDWGRRKLKVKILKR